jgi:hypothetical protein
MKGWLGAVVMVGLQLLVLFAVQLFWHRAVPDWLIEEHLVNPELLESGSGNDEIFRQVVAVIRNQVGLALTLVGAIAIAVSIGWYCIAELSEIPTPGHVDGYRGTWWLLAVLGLISASLVAWIKLPTDVGGIGPFGLPFAGGLVFLLLFYAIGSLLWTPRPMRPVVPGAWRFSIL